MDGIGFLKGFLRFEIICDEDTQKETNPILKRFFGNRSE